jgi:RNA polymerase sigma-70 factor (ECF subfamily)
LLASFFVCVRIPVFRFSICYQGGIYQSYESMSDDANKVGDFSTTHWSVVLEAGRTDAARTASALERLCRQYWKPIYVFVRRRGSKHHEAEDLTQAFFAHLLEKQTLKAVDRRKGKFRSFLLASLTNFLLNEWDKRQTLKRGGRQHIISLDEATADKLYNEEPVDQFSPEKLFERCWALTIVGQVFTRLREEYAAANKADLFLTLEAGLTGEMTPGLYANWAADLNMSEGAVKVALHRLRRRFGELLRSEVAYTVADPEEVAEEIRHLLAAISN